MEFLFGFYLGGFFVYLGEHWFNRFEKATIEGPTHFGVILLCAVFWPIVFFCNVILEMAVRPYIDR